MAGAPRRSPSVIQLTVNGRAHRVDAPPETPLLHVLRDALRLNGAKYGCGQGQCGACTVLVDDEPVPSCLAPVGGLAGARVRTVESFGTAARPSRLQAAFLEEQALQCGYCTAGMVVRAEALLARNPRPTEAEIRRWMEPVLCRCGAQMRVLRAIQRAAQRP